MRKKIVEETAKIRAPVKHARFYGTPGRDPIGYMCNGVRIDRNRNETWKNYAPDVETRLPGRPLIRCVFLCL